MGVLALAAKSVFAAEVSILNCDLQYTNASKAPFWKTVGAVFSQPNVIGVPALIDTKPTNFGGSNPSFDSMVYCSTQTISSQSDGSIKIGVVIKRTLSVVDSNCSQLKDSDVLSTQTDTFGIDELTLFDYRFYEPNKASEQRRRVVYFGNPSEFGNFDAQSSQTTCDSIANSMPGFGRL